MFNSIFFQQKKKFLYILTSPLPRGTVSQKYLKSCLQGYSFQKGL